MLKKLNKVLVTLEKSYLSYMMASRDIFYMEVIALDGIYKFIVLSFFILDHYVVQKTIYSFSSILIAYKLLSPSKNHIFFIR